MPPELQDISGIVAAGAPQPRDGAQLKSFPLLKEGHTLVVKRLAAPRPAAAAASASGAGAAAGAGAGAQRMIRVDWKNNCTRVYFAQQTVSQVC